MPNYDGIAAAGVFFRILRWPTSASPYPLASLHLLRHPCDEEGEFKFASAALADGIEEWLDGEQMSSTTCPAIFVDADTMLDEWMDYKSRNTDEGQRRLQCQPSYQLRRRRLRLPIGAAEQSSREIN
jgi:hypothetical protein